MKRVLCACAASLALGAATAARADTITLNPIADAFVVSAQPGNNYGGAGALNTAASGLPQGEFQSVMRFDTAAATAALDASYGVGQWTIQSVTLRLVATNPSNNPIFNAAAAGQFAASWMTNDAWVEGTGNPMTPTTNGITFATLPSFLSGGDEALGTFSFVGGISGAATYALGLSTGFVSDIAAGGNVGLRLLAADSTVSYAFNSRTFSQAPSRPQLAITATPEPASLFGGLLLALVALRRR